MSTPIRFFTTRNLLCPGGAVVRRPLSLFGLRLLFVALSLYWAYDTWILFRPPPLYLGFLARPIPVQTLVIHFGQTAVTLLGLWKIARWPFILCLVVMAAGLVSGGIPSSPSGWLPWVVVVIGLIMTLRVRRAMAMPLPQDNLIREFD